MFRKSGIEDKINLQKDGNKQSLIKLNKPGPLFLNISLVEKSDGQIRGNYLLER